MPTTCDIELQNNNGSNIVYAGQELCGTVRLILTEGKHLRGIYIHIYGKGFCQWLQVRTTHTGQADYLNEVIYFIGGENGNLHLEPHTYTYNFRCLLPAQLPGSVEGELGYIKYSACVVLASFSTCSDQKFEQKFSVARQLNLNDYPELRQNIVADASYKCGFSDILCYCRLLSLPPTIFVAIPMSGYVPQQTIHVQIHVKNRSGKSNCEFDVKLIKQIHYISEHPVQLDQKEKQTVVKKTVYARIDNSHEIINVDLHVPPLPPSDLMENNIINITYYIDISGSTGFCDQTPIVKIPVTIGTYPIQNVELNPGAIVSSAPPQQLVFGNSDDSEPPSYAEATANESSGDFRSK